MARKPDPSLRPRILREAEHLLHLRGYRCTSLDDIASRLGMTKANLLHHFRSKEELGLAVLDYKIDAYRRERLARLERCGDPVKAVAELFSAASGFFRGNGCRAGCFVGNIALEMSDVSDRFRRKVVLFFEDWVGSLQESLRRARGAGAFSAAMDPRACAEAVLALYEGAIMLARSRRDPEVFVRVGRQACGLLERHRSPNRSVARRGETPARNASTKGGYHGTQNALRVLSP